MHSWPSVWERGTSTWILESRLYFIADCYDDVENISNSGSKAPNKIVEAETSGGKRLNLDKARQKWNTNRPEIID